MTSWTSPFNLSILPDVLAGPMLRAVTPTSVTVWFALKRAATDVRLTVSDTGGPILTGHRKTYAIGPNLHLVAVTANMSQPGRPAAMVPGVIYTYDVMFDFAGAPNTTLASATNGASIAYAPLTQPSFCLPPKDLNKMRLMHGSCRHPNADAGTDHGGGGRDALALLDILITQHATEPDRRPHQLLLTGDQIYADDVAGHLLMALTAMSDLLLFQEVLPLPATVWSRWTGAHVPVGSLTANKIAAFSRTLMGDAIGLTSDAKSNHLFSLGEYICMYLFVWSDALWTAAQLPNSDNVKAAAKSSLLLDRKALEELLEDEIESVAKFRETLPDVRRALANIPSYMILDDHEVTDDFNMEREFFEKIYADDNPMGQRVIQNGLVAYALCQHWGNKPEQFFDPDLPAPAPPPPPGGKPAPPPGLRLLQLLDGGTAATYETNSTALKHLVGVHKLSEMKNPPTDIVGLERAKVLSAYHDADALNYDYTVEGELYQILVTDSRTWRSVPNNSIIPQLMPKDQILRQITNAMPATTIPAVFGAPGTPAVDRLLIVVLSTNAPPVKIIRFAPAEPELAKLQSGPDDPHPDLWDSWELPSASFDHLMHALSERMPLVADRANPAIKWKRGAALILSGDVHASFATRLLFNGLSRPDDPITRKQPVNMVVAQLVSSSLRNQTAKTFNQHRHGYDYPHRILLDTIPEGYFGWGIPLGGALQIGIERTHPYLVTVRDDPFFVHGPNAINLTPGLTLSKKPEYMYRLDYIKANRAELDTSFGKYTEPPNIANPTAAQRAAWASQYHVTSQNYATYDRGFKGAREMVGANNLSEINFDWGATDDARTVLQAVYWVGGAPANKGDVAMISTLYEVSLNPDNKDLGLMGVTPVIGAPAIAALP